MAIELKGKVALITGASRGIGRAIALRLAEAGMSLVLAARSMDALTEVAELARERGGRAEPVRCDLLQLDDMQRLAAQPGRLFGGLDLLVNNAGGTHYKPVCQGSHGDLDGVLGLNLWSVMVLTQACLPTMLAGGHGGTIINISSIAGVYGSPGLSAYAAAKAGLITWTDSLFEELRREGIKVCAISPGEVDNDREYEEHGMAMEDVAEAVHYVAGTSGRVCPTQIHLKEQMHPEWLKQK